MKNPIILSATERRLCSNVLSLHSMATEAG